MAVSKAECSDQVSSDILCEFLEVAIHSILFTRQLYPPGVFQRKKKYNVPIQVACHPDLTLYISDLIGSLCPLLEQKAVNRVDFIVCCQTDGSVLERFVFEIMQSKVDVDTGSSQQLLKLEQMLRDFLLKLNLTSSSLKPLCEDPVECSWSVQVHTTQSSALSLQETQHIQDFTWITADTQAQQMAAPVLTPLKSSECGLFKMQMYLEASGDR